MNRIQLSPIDLWATAKKVKARFTYKPTIEDVSHKELARLSYEAMEAVRDNPTVKNAKLFCTAEKNYLNHWKSTSTLSYSERVLEAIRNKNFNFASKPYKNIINMGDKDDFDSKGYVYIARSENKPNQIKFGYTTLTLRQRAQKYRLRYSIDFEITHSVYVECPQMFERELQIAFKDFRVAQNTNGESNEWFFSNEFCNEKTVLKLLRKIAVTKNLSILKKIIWDD